MRVATGIVNGKSLEDSVRDALPPGLQHAFDVVLRLASVPAPPESQGVYGTPDAIAKKGAELAASGDALPEGQG